MPASAKQVDTNLALNVLNKLRELSQGERGVTSNQLADAILKERVPNPKSAIVTAMRAQVLIIIKAYFPYANAETPIKLGQGGKHHPTNTFVKIIDKDALLRDLITFIHTDLGASDLLSDDLKARCIAYMQQAKRS